MATVSTYLNFPGNTEEAFNYYKSIFGGDFVGSIMRFKDMPPQEGMPPLTDKEKEMIVNIGLILLGGHLLMGTDAPESMGFSLKFGNNSYIMLRPDTREETIRLFNGLSAGGKVEMELQDMFWGDFYGSCADKFGVQWMFNCEEKSPEK